MRTLVVIILLASQLANAATKTWTGATNSDWNTGSNWGGSAPAAGDIANIPGGLTNYPIVNNTVTITTININSSGSGATLTVTTGGFLTASGLITVNANGSFIINGGTAKAAGVTSSNIINISGGTLLSTVNLILNSGATLTQSDGLIHMATSTGTDPTDNLIINSGATLNQSGGTLYIKDYAAGGGTFNQTGSTALFKIFRDWKPGTGSVFNSTAGTVQFSGSGGAGPDFASGTSQFSNIIVDAGVDPGFSNTAASTINISGNFTNNNTTLVNTTASTFTFNGTSPQTITSASTGSNATFGNLTINTTSTVTLASNIYIAGDLSVLAGTFDQGSYTLTRTAAGGTISMSSGTYLTAGTGIPSNFTTNNFSSGSTVIFNGNVTETIPAYNFANLTSSGTGARILASTGTIGISGVFTPGTNSYTITGSTINFNGTGNQTIPAFNYNNLTASGARTSNYLTYAGSGIIKIAGTFNPAATFTTGGRIITGSTIEFNGTGAQTIPAFTYNNLTTSGARTTFSLTYSGTGTIAIAGTFTPSATFTTGGRIITGSTIDFNGAGAQTIPAFTYNNLTSSNTGTRTLASSGTIGVAGNFTPGTNTYTVTGSTVDFNGSGAQTIGGITFNNLTTSNAGTKTSAGNITVNGTFTVTSPTIFSPGAADVISGTGTLTGTGTIQVTRITGTPDFSSQYTISNVSMSTLGIDYNGAGAQTVSSVNYGNLTISTNGTRTVTLAGSGTIGVSGIFSPSATTTTYVVTGSTVNFKGSGAQTIPAFTFNNITTSTGGTKTTAGNIVANGTFTVSLPTIFNPGATHVISGSGTLTGTGEIYVTKITVTADLATQYSIANKTITNLTIDYSGAGAQTINSTFGSYSTLKTSGSGMKTLQGAITVTGDIIINAGTLDVSASNFGITLSGNFTNNVAAANFDDRLGTVTFIGNSSSINGSATSEIFYNVIINKTAGQTLTVGGSTTALTVNDFTQTTGNFTAPATFSINGNVLLSAGTFTTGTVTVAGNWTNNGGTVSGTSVIFSGTAKTIGGTMATTFPDFTVTTGTVTLNTSSSCTGFNLANNNVATSFTLSTGVTLTVNGNAVINQASGGGVAHSVNVNDGTLTVNGSLTVSVIANNAGRVARMVITTGTVNITGDLVINNTVDAANGVIDMSGGAGNLNLYGNFTVNTLITFTPGTASKVSYLGTGAQSVAAGTSVTYNNLVINKPSGTGTLTGALTVANITLTQGIFSVSGSNYLITLSGNWTNNGGTFSPGTGDVLLNGTGTISGTTSTTFADINVGALSTGYTMSNNNSCFSLIFDVSALSTTFTHSGTAALTISGAVTINQPSTTATMSWNINAGAATVSGLITLAGTNNGATRIGQIAITTGTLNAHGGISFAGSTPLANKVIDMSGGAGTLNMKGALTFANLSGTLNAGTLGSIFNYADNSAAQTVNFFPGGAYHNLYINTTGSTGATLSAAISTTNVTGNLRVQSGTLSNGTFAIALNTSKTFEVANGAIFKMTGTTGMVTGTSITKTFGVSSTCDYNGTAQTVSAELYGNLIISGARTTNNVTLASSGTIGIAGTFTASASFTSGNYVITGSTVDFNSASAQNIPAFTFNNLTVSTSAKTANGIINVNAIFTLSSSVLTTTSSNLLIIKDNATSTGASYTAYVNGPVRKVGDDAFTFPVGKSGTGYMLVGISAPSVVTDAFTAEYMRNSGTSLGSVTATGLFRVSNCDYWNLDRTTGSSSVNVTLSWNGYSNCNLAAYVNDLATLTIAHFNGTNWDTHGKSSSTGNVSSGTITRNGVSAFSPFAIGTSSDYTNPLEVNFTSIKAYKLPGGNKIEWTNQTETNIDHYDIERSVNNGQFMLVREIKATVNNGSKASYDWLDTSPLNSTIFYRIKAVSIDGKITYSTTVKINRDQSSELLIYPNPVTNKKLTIQTGNTGISKLQVEVIDISGRNILSQSVMNGGTNASLVIDLPANIKPGMYSLRLSANNESQVKTFIVQ